MCFSDFPHIGLCNPFWQKIFRGYYAKILRSVLAKNITEKLNKTYKLMFILFVMYLSLCMYYVFYIVRCPCAISFLRSVRNGNFRKARFVSL